MTNAFLFSSCPLPLNSLRTARSLPRPTLCPFKRQALASLVDP